MTDKKMPPKPTFWSPDKPVVTTINPQLAAEIGLNESIVLRQIVFWINSTNQLHDGAWWTYQSLSDMKEKAFPYWSKATISRAINSLVESGYIKKTDKYNKRKSDRTQWFTVCVDACSKLRSVRLVLQNEKSSNNPFHNETGILHNETGILHNETTLPDYNLQDYNQQTNSSHEPAESDTAASTDDSESVSSSETPNPDDTGGIDLKPVLKKLVNTLPSIQDATHIELTTSADRLKSLVSVHGLDSVLHAIDKCAGKVVARSKADGMADNERIGDPIGYIAGICKSDDHKADVHELTRKRPELTKYTAGDMTANDNREELAAMFKENPFKSKSRPRATAAPKKMDATIDDHTPMSNLQKALREKGMSIADADAAMKEKGQNDDDAA